MLQMSSAMLEAVESTLNRLETYAVKKEPFDIYPYIKIFLQNENFIYNTFFFNSLYQSLTLDVVCRCVFGFQSDCQFNDEDQFLLLCKQVFADIVKISPINYMASEYHEIISYQTILR